jgi:hypothetical protein
MKARTVAGGQGEGFTMKSSVVSAAIGTAALLAGCGGGVPSTVHGTVTSTALKALGDPGNCILNLPDQGSQIKLKADGVTVAVAQLEKGGYHTKRTGLGEICWVNFTFTDVPGGKNLYEVTVNVDHSTVFSDFGCHGTVYYKPAKLSKPLHLSCD